MQLLITEINFCFKWFRMADYNMKIPRELADLFGKYIEKNKQLGYRTVSQYIMEVLRKEAKRIIDEIK